MIQPTSAKPRCFVLIPLSGETEEIYRSVIVPALAEEGYEVLRADRIATAGNIIREILAAIVDADLLIADLTGRNPNVFLRASCWAYFG